MPRILFLAANPRDSDPLRLNAEMRDIEEVLSRSTKREQFEINTKVALTPRLLLRSLLEQRPGIVHFAGHADETDGLILEDQDGEPEYVSADDLEEIFEFFAKYVHCVVLNACYSEVQAHAIAKHIPVVVGMQHAISDKAAIAFAVGFYEALGEGEDYEGAIKLGRLKMKIDKTNEQHTPQLICSDKAQAKVVAALQLGSKLKTEATSLMETEEKANLNFVNSNGEEKLKNEVIRAKLEDLLKNQSVVDIYKQLHHCLHLISKECDALRRVIFRIKDRPSDTALELLEKVTSIKRHLTTAKTNTEKLTPENDVSSELLWIRRIDDIVDTIENATVKQAKAKMALDDLKSIVGEHLGRLDTVMKTHSQHLRLDQLATLLKENSIGSDLESGENPIHELTALNWELRRSIRLHHEWQKVCSTFWISEQYLHKKEIYDDNLYLSNELSGDILEKIYTNLNKLKSEINFQERPPNQLRLFVQKLDAVLKNWRHIDSDENEFYRLKIQAEDKYFKADESLKSVCGKVVKAGQPIGNALVSGDRGV